VPAAPAAAAGWTWLGRIPFARAAALQESAREAVLAGAGPETLFLCEHDPVISLGRSARPEHVLLAPAELARRGIQLEEASRGGAVTYHGPGQLVGYPVFRLRGGVLAHVQAMAGGIIAVLEQLGIRAEWQRERPGVWVGPDKICAFGIHVRHRVAIHGFALNVDPAPEAWSAIVPCGLASAGVTSIARHIADPPPLPALAAAVAAAFERSFGMILRGLPLVPHCQTENQIANMISA
jgi:lipoate-protein ligase B